VFGETLPPLLRAILWTQEFRLGDESLIKLCERLAPFSTAFLAFS
jgi:hypothetical protein